MQLFYLSLFWDGQLLVILLAIFDICIWRERLTELLGEDILMHSVDAPEPPWSKISQAVASLHFLFFYFFCVCLLIKCGNLSSWQGSGRETVLWIANLAPAQHFSPSKVWAKGSTMKGQTPSWWMRCIGWVRLHKYCLCVLRGKWSFTSLLRAYMSPRE